MNQGRTPSGQAPAAQDLMQAVALFQQQRFAEAEPLARALTQRFPRDSQAWKLLAAVCRRLGRPGEALASIREAVALAPHDWEAQTNLGNALHDLGQWPQAQAAYQQAIALNPQAGMAHSGLAGALLALGRPAEAEASARRALVITPGHVLALNQLGNAQQAQHRLDEAEQSYRQAIALDTGFADAHGNLGALLHRQGRLAEALASWQTAVQLQPQDAGKHHNLGIALSGQGRLAEAQQQFQQALLLDPHHASALNGLAQTLREQGHPEQAQGCLRKAIQIQPDFADAHNNLATVLHDCGRFDESEQAARRALHIDPNFTAALGSLGNALRDQGQLAAAEQCYLQALKQKPDYAPAYDNLLFTLNYDADKTPQQIFAAYDAYEQQFGQPLRGGWRPHANARAARRRLRVGYVSPDFRQHSCRYFAEPLLAHHDKADFEVHAYAELALEDAVTARYRGHVDHWTPTLGLSDEALAQRMRDDGIDILVDLAGHTRSNRLPAFARKPAPVAVSWLGFGYTTGLRAIDYFLGDAHTLPPTDAPWFSESPWRLDGPAFAYRPAPDMGEPGPLPALTRGHVTFGTLTRAVRLNPAVLRAWAAILKQVENARLVVDSADFRSPAMQQRLLRQFAELGIAPERLSIGHHSPPWDVLRGLDIALDCFPHNSGTTLFESLYMGLPFVTLSSRPGVGRLGGAILHAMQRPHWIAADEAEYVGLAVALARDLPALATQRAALRGQMQRSPLMDEAAFTRRVEAAYRQMWERWLG